MRKAFEFFSFSFSCFPLFLASHYMPWLVWFCIYDFLFMRWAQNRFFSLVLVRAYRCRSCGVVALRILFCCFVCRACYSFVSYVVPFLLVSFFVSVCGLLLIRLAFRPGCARPFVSCRFFVSFLIVSCVVFCACFCLVSYLFVHWFVCFFVSSCRVVMCVSFSFVMCFLFFCPGSSCSSVSFFSSCRLVVLRVISSVCVLVRALRFSCSCQCSFVVPLFVLRIFVLCFSFMCLVLVPYFCPCEALWGDLRTFNDYH